MIILSENQLEAISKLKTGSILCGGVGSGKSRTSLAYYIKHCGGSVPINGQGKRITGRNVPLYIITTAKKRDSNEWLLETGPFGIGNVVIDSWNNIKKYAFVKDAFFILDEQRLVGAGTWVKVFLKIAKHNDWILLTATPGDSWLDYIPVFVANGFYKNRSEFLRIHAVYSRFTKYPKIEKFMEQSRLIKYRDEITVVMPYERETVSHEIIKTVSYDKTMFDTVMIKRWDVFNNEPVKSISQLFYLMRKVVNMDHSRLLALNDVLEKHKRLIIFYNFDYELFILREHLSNLGLLYTEWNGHKHEAIPNNNSWIYLVQYTAGAEGWECITTNAVLFYSLNYSYKVMVQAAGRINRRNTTYKDLYYYHLRSNSPIDLAISKAIKQKKNFNANKFMDI